MNIIPCWFFSAAILLFIAFLNLHIKPGRLQRMILAAAPLSFGVYLLHDNPNVRGFVWETLNPSRLAGAWYLVPGVLLLAAAVFAVCALTEWLRKIDCLSASTPSEEKHSLPARILRTGLRRSG